jgi:hypothetical protein
VSCNFGQLGGEFVVCEEAVLSAETGHMAAISVAIRDILILGVHEMRVQLGLCSSTLALVLMATAAWAEIRLSGTQIDAHVSGNTLKITTKNLQEARGYFIPDGSVKGRDGSLEFAQYDTRLDHSGIDTSVDRSDLDTRLDKTGIDTKLDKTGMDTRLDETGMDTRLDQTGIDNPANPIRQAQPAGDGALIVPIAPPSAITGSPGVTIIGAPAEGDAIESSTGPTIIRAHDATQE